jgi:hypothetical protein
VSLLALTEADETTKQHSKCTVSVVIKITTKTFKKDGSPNFKKNGYI